MPLCLIRWDEFIHVNNTDEWLWCNAKEHTLYIMKTACDAPSKVDLEAVPHAKSLISPEALFL